ncbi:DUF4345 domain-containing protein [Flavobacterium sp. TSSA_36]|uniref:DUF4345 domain-containing protein n=1 Tax=Flavobacterium sp. TSSA_36 TaxID=3447669 RepID=UPI003F2D4C59
MSTTSPFFKKLHLIISAAIVVPVGLIYGVKPDFLFEVSLQSPDEFSIFKAIMGLYLGFSFFWLFGIFQKQFWKAATISNMIFMLGLAFGRLVSMFLDGLPSVVFLLGTVGELVLGVYAYYQLADDEIG